MGERTWYNIPLTTAMPIPADFQHALMEKLFTQGIITPSFLPWAASTSMKRWFATLGLSSSYWQIEVKPEDRHKMAFILPSGLFEFMTLPMGLANAAATCRRVMQYYRGCLANTA